MWEAQVLDYYRRTGKDPGYEDVADRPELPRVHLTDPDRRLLERREGTIRLELESRYVALEKNADSYMLFNFLPG